VESKNIKAEIRFSEEAMDLILSTGKKWFVENKEVHPSPLTSGSPDHYEI